MKSDPFIFMSYLLKYLCIYNHFHLNFYVVIQYFARTSIWWRPFTLKWILWYGNVWQLSPNSFPYQISSPKRIRWITMYLCFLLTTKDFFMLNGDSNDWNGKRNMKNWPLPMLDGFVYCGYLLDHMLDHFHYSLHQKLKVWNVELYT